MREVSSRRQHLAKRIYGETGLSIRCSCGEYESAAVGVGTVRQQEDAHRAHRVEMGERVKDRAPSPLEQAQARITQLEGQLERYVGKEPTVRDEMAYLQRKLNSVRELCDEARLGSCLGITIEAVEQAVEGERVLPPDDKRRRIYIDGNGSGWVDLSVDNHGLIWLRRISNSDAHATPDSIRAETGGLYEIGRCW